MDTQTERLPALITRAAKALAEATTAAEVLDAKDAAAAAFSVARAEGKFHKKRKAHDEVVAACRRAMADALIIETQAQCRLADEYDAAQERGEMAKRTDSHAFRANSPHQTGNGTSMGTLADAGLTGSQLHECRKVRDAEKARPGIVRDTLEAALTAGKDPSRSGVERAVDEIAPRSRTPKSGPKPHQPRPQADKIAALHDAGLSTKDIASEVGMGERNVSVTLREELVKRQAVATMVSPDTLSLSAQQKLEAAIRQHKRQLDLEFEQRVQAEVQSRLEATILPHYNEKYNLYMSVIKARKGIMDRASYRKILAALHPDRQLDPALKKRAADAFNLFTKIEKLVLDEKESPTGDESLPKTYADLMARRKPTAKRGNGEVRQR
jgi:lambda repressor-like predicted transcriptional regulator